MKAEVEKVVIKWYGGVFCNYEDVVKLVEALEAEIDRLNEKVDSSNRLIDNMVTTLEHLVKNVRKE